MAGGLTFVEDRTVSGVAEGHVVPKFIGRERERLELSVLQSRKYANLHHTPPNYKTKGTANAATPKGSIGQHA
eukprot:2938853-Pyramimonas_sp.AAC.2